MNTDLLAIIALGSNLGDSTRTVLLAIQRLRDLSAQPLRASSLWQSTPLDCPPGSPLFVNAVVALLPQAGETPESLLPKLQALEREFGRQARKIPNEPRPLDLDLIAFGRERRRSTSLTLPHPRALQRRFVLQPLAEILPGMILPGSSSTVLQSLQRLPPDPNMVPLKS